VGVGTFLSPACPVWVPWKKCKMSKVAAWLAMGRVGKVVGHTRLQIGDERSNQCLMAAGSATR